MENPWRKVYDLPESVNPWKNGVPKFALYLDVEPTNFCNFNCSFCMTNQMTRKKGYMPIERFEKICEQGKKYGTYGIRFLRWGEPLKHPNIKDLIITAKRKGLLMQVTTNGFYLNNDDMCRNLIQSGLDSIIISFQGTNPEEYKKFRGDFYYRTFASAQRLIEMRTKLGSNYPYITISTTLTDETEQQLEKFKNDVKDICDYVSVGYTWFKRLKNKDKVQEQIKRAKELPHYFRCQEVMIKLSIDWDGAISPCCLDYDQQLNVGNIEKDDLMDIWKSDNVKAIRTLLTNKKQDLFTLCSTCELNYNFRGKK